MCVRVCERRGAILERPQNAHRTAQAKEGRERGRLRSEERLRIGCDGARGINGVGGRHVLEDRTCVQARPAQEVATVWNGPHAWAQTHLILLAMPQSSKVPKARWRNSSVIFRPSPLT